MRLRKHAARHAMSEQSDAACTDPFTEHFAWCPRHHPRLYAKILAKHARRRRSR